MHNSPVQTTDGASRPFVYTTNTHAVPFVIMPEPMPNTSRRPRRAAALTCPRMAEFAETPGRRSVRLNCLVARDPMRAPIVLVVTDPISIPNFAGPSTFALRFRPSLDTRHRSDHAPTNANHTPLPSRRAPAITLAAAVAARSSARAQLARLHAHPYRPTTTQPSPIAGSCSCCVPDVPRGAR
jgi:hypothetical protein